MHIHDQWILLAGCGAFRCNQQSLELDAVSRFPRERGHPACPGLFNDRVRPVNHPTVARTNIERPHAEGPQHVERGPEDSPAIGRDFEPLDLLVERTGNPDIDAAIVLQPTQAVEQGPRAARRPELSLPTPLKTTGVDPGNLLHGFSFTTFEVPREARKREKT